MRSLKASVSCTILPLAAREVGPWARVSCIGDDTGTFYSIDEEAFVDIAEKSRAAKSSAWNEPGSALNAGLF